MKVLSCEYDFVVVGGGVAGTVAAIAAARLGVKTALVQNRPVLGGPSGSECCQNSDGAFITGAPEYVNRGAMETGILEEMRREAYLSFRERLAAALESRHAGVGGARSEPDAPDEYGSP